MIRLSPDLGFNITFSILVFMMAYFLGKFFKKSLDVAFVGVKQRISHARVVAKTRTVRSLLKSIVDVVFFTLAILVILSKWGINIAPLIAGAGIVGLAISFGSQSLVKDIIAGFFIIVEDQYNIGDKVKIANQSGLVYKITLRSTDLVDDEQNLIHIPNSQIQTVIKFPATPPSPKNKRKKKR